MALSAAEKQAAYRERQKGLEAAKARGRALGEDEADRRHEFGEERTGRIRRAEAYAVWEFNDKPMTGEPLSVTDFIEGSI